MFKRIVTLSALALIISSQAFAQSLFSNRKELTQDQKIESEIQEAIDKTQPITASDYAEMQYGLNRSINDLAIDTNSKDTEEIIKYINFQKSKTAEYNDKSFEPIENVNTNNQEAVIDFYNKVFRTEYKARK